MGYRLHFFSELICLQLIECLFKYSLTAQVIDKDKGCDPNDQLRLMFFHSIRASFASCIQKNQMPPFV